MLGSIHHCLYTQPPTLSAFECSVQSTIMKAVALQRQEGKRIDDSGGKDTGGVGDMVEGEADMGANTRVAHSSEVTALCLSPSHSLVRPFAL